MMFKAFPFTSLESTDEMFDCLKALTKQNKSEYVIRQVFKYIIDVHTREVLKSRELPIDLKGIILYSTDLAISGENEDKLDLNNIYLRTFDIIAAGVEKGIHNAVSIYKRAKIFKPNVKLSVKSNFVIQFFMEQGVLQLLQYQNPVEEISAYASARIVGPGGLPNADAVQPKDRGLRSSHFGNFDPTDTSEGDPGTRLYLTSGHFYDTNVNSFLKMENSDSNKNIFGPAASLTPFGDKDDQARLNMASNQARQAVPILSSEPPMVGSGYESNVAALCSGTFTKKAKANGKVEYVDKNVIIVTYEDGKKESLDIRPTNLISGSGLDSALTYEVGVKVGDKVSKDQMLATNQFIKPVLSQGVNAKTCYLSYMGYNYEDGLIISQSLADKMTSIHYDSIESSIYVNDIIDVFPQIGQEFNTGETVFKLKKHVIAGASLADTYEVTAPSKLKVFDIEVYPVDRDSLKHITSQIEENYRDSNEALRSHGLKPVFDMERIVKYTGKWEEDGEKLKYSKVVIKMLRYMNMSLGDKASNRHAAKVRRSIS